MMTEESFLFSLRRREHFKREREISKIKTHTALHCVDYTVCHTKIRELSNNAPYIVVAHFYSFYIEGDDS